MAADLIITRVDQARLLLAEAKDAPTAKRVVDVAHAAETYARRQKLSEEVIANAREIRCEAESLLGRFLKDAPKNEGVKMDGRDKFGGSRKEPPKQQPPTLAEIGITKKESAKAQFVAEVQEKTPQKFEAYKRGEKSIAALKRESRNGSKPKNGHRNSVSVSAGKAKDLEMKEKHIASEVGSLLMVVANEMWPADRGYKRLIETLRYWVSTLEVRDKKREAK